MPLPHLGKRLITLHHILDAHESKASWYEELFASKHIALVYSSILDSVSFIFSIDTIIRDKMSMSCDVQYMLCIRNRQTTSKDRKHFDSLIFPEEWNLFN